MDRQCRISNALTSVMWLSLAGIPPIDSKYRPAAAKADPIKCSSLRLVLVDPERRGQRSLRPAPPASTTATTTATGAASEEEGDFHAVLRADTEFQRAREK